MKKSFCLLWALLTTLSCVGSPTSMVRAGIMLDGVPESTYVALAQAPQFNSIGRFAEGFSGTLIAPNWVLTAAHVTEVTEFQIRGTGTAHSVAEIIRHPSYVNLNLGFDIALVRLNTSVAGVTPASIYRGSNEIGQIATITGFGFGGIGSQGSQSLPQAQRAGTNTFDTFLNFGNSAPQALLTDFDAPVPSPVANTLGSVAPTANEYQLADFDSGGGTFIFENGEWKLAGINSGIAPQSALIGGGSTNPRGYGAIGVYTRVTSFQQFIDDTLVAVPEPSSFALGALGVGTLICYSVRRRSKQAVARTDAR